MGPAGSRVRSSWALLGLGAARTLGSRQPSLARLLSASQIGFGPRAPEVESTSRSLVGQNKLLTCDNSTQEQLDANLSTGLECCQFGARDSEVIGRIRVATRSFGLPVFGRPLDGAPGRPTFGPVREIGREVWACRAATKAKLTLPLAPTVGKAQIRTNRVEPNESERQN